MYLIGMPPEATRKAVEPLFPQSAIHVPIMNKTRHGRVLHGSDDYQPNLM
jgi:hypothetical protein